MQIYQDGRLVNFFPNDASHLARTHVLVAEPKTHHHNLCKLVSSLKGCVRQGDQLLTLSTTNFGKHYMSISTHSNSNIVNLYMSRGCGTF